MRRTIKPTSETLASVLRHCRHRKALSMGELAEKANVSKPYLSLIETGRFDGQMSESVIQRLCAALGLDAEEWQAKEYLSRIPRKFWWMISVMIEDTEGEDAPKGKRTELSAT